MTLGPEVTVGAATLKGVTPESRKATLDLGDAEPTEAVIREACRYAFDGLGLHRVSLWLDVGDPAIAAYEAVGFMNEGRARDRAWRDGGWQDCVLLGLLAGELT